MDPVHLQGLCRICLQALPKMRKECYTFAEPLDKYANTTFAEAFLSCTGCNIQDKEPQRMCLSCATELMLAFDLRVKCYQTQEVLDKLCSGEEEPEEEEFIYQDTSLIQPYEEYEQVEEIEYKPDIKPKLIEISKKKTQKVDTSMVEFTIIGDKTFACDYCSSHYPTNNALRFHLELSHPEQKCHECPNCNQFLFQSTFEAHVNNCCAPETTVITTTKGPKRKRTPNKKELCPICAEMRTPYHIKCHIERSQQLDADGNVITHPYICDICGTRKTAKSYILQHIRNEHLNKFVKCRYCPAEFKHPSTLYSHERRDHTDKVPRLKCKFCEFRSATHSSLRVHTYSKHTGEKKHKCEICFSRFVTKWKLQEHSACHTNETPYPCDVCNGKFKTKEGVRRHQTKAHGIYKMKR